MHGTTRHDSAIAQRLLTAMLLATAVFATAWAGVLLTRYGDRIATVWLANAMVLAVLLRSPRHRWGELLASACIGNVTANLLNGDPFLQAAALTALNLLEAGAAAVLMAPFLATPKRFADPVEVADLRFLAALLLIGGALAPALSASGAVLFLKWQGAAPAAGTFIRWFLADATGILVLTPLLLSIRLARPGRMHMRQLAEVTATLVGLGALTFVVFHQNAPFLYLILAALIFVAIRFTIGQSAFAIIMVAAVAIQATATGTGPAFAVSSDPAVQSLVLEAFIAAAMFVTLPVAAVLAERRRLLSRVADKERQFRRMAEASPAGILQFGAAGEVVFANRRWTELTGQSFPFATAIQWLDSFQGGDRRSLAALWTTARTHGEARTAELRYRQAEGSTSWADVSMTPEKQPDGCLTGWVVRLLDISARRYAEEIAERSSAQLREANRLLTMAEGLGNLGHWRVDGTPLGVEFSAQARAILGIGRREEIAISKVLGIVDPADRRALLAALVDVRADGGPQSCRVRIRRRSGPVRHVQVEIQADHKPESGIAALFGVMRDITDKIVGQQTLIAARDDAEAANRAKSEFLATMSHEIRTPMTGVMGMIELLRGEITNKERERYLGAMKQSAELLMAVLDGILDFSKVESGKLELDCGDFDFAALVKHTIDMFQNAASKKGLLFELQLDCGQSAYVNGDPVRLQQVISNLISNAIKFTERGRVGLSVVAKLQRGHRQRWHVEVSDTGVGIAADELEQLFEPFVQKGQRRFGGTGLGLAISRRLIEAMGGKTGVRSHAGRGSTFWFDISLPIGSKGADEILTDAIAEPVDGPLHVLVAEDNPINQMLIGAMVRRLGHRVTCVDNGRRALDAARSVAFDAILIDMQMPEMDGIAATRAIRASGGRNALVPIIALTADAAPERRRFYDNAGLTAFMTKPIDAELLRTHLTAAAGSSGSLPTTQLPIDESPIDESRLTELRNMLGPAKLHGLLMMLATELTSRPALLRQAAQDEILDELRTQAHSLKGAVENLGVVGVARAAKAIELASAGPELELALARLDCEVAHAQRAIGRLMGPPKLSRRRTA